MKNSFVSSFGGVVSIGVAFSSNYIKANESNSKIVVLFGFYSQNDIIFRTVPNRIVFAGLIIYTDSQSKMGARIANPIVINSYWKQSQYNTTNYNPHIH